MGAKITVTIEIEVELRDRRDYVDELGPGVTAEQAAESEASGVYAEDDQGGSKFRVTGWKIDPPDPWDGYAGEVSIARDDRVMAIDFGIGSQSPGSLTGR